MCDAQPWWVWWHKGLAPNADANLGARLPAHFPQIDANSRRLADKRDGNHSANSVFDRLNRVTPRSAPALPEDFSFSPDRNAHSKEIWKEQEAARVEVHRREVQRRWGGTRCRRKGEVVDTSGDYDGVGPPELTAADGFPFRPQTNAPPTTQSRLSRGRSSIDRHALSIERYHRRSTPIQTDINSILFGNTRASRKAGARSAATAATPHAATSSVELNRKRRGSVGHIHPESQLNSGSGADAQPELSTARRISLTPAAHSAADGRGEEAGQEDHKERNDGQ